MFGGDFRGHCLNRPVAVRGAAPGDMLKVEIVSLTPDAWGWTVVAGGGRLAGARAARAGRGGPGLAAVGDRRRGGHRHRERQVHQVARPVPRRDRGRAAGPGEHSTIPPRAEAGGNIDCKELVAGSVLYLPVNTDGALLYLGDGHAAQGDGESCGTAIECGMTTEAVVSHRP